MTLEMKEPQSVAADGALETAHTTYDSTNTTPAAANAQGGGYTPAGSLSPDDELALPAGRCLGTTIDGDTAEIAGAWIVCSRTAAPGGVVQRSSENWLLDAAVYARDGDYQRAKFAAESGIRALDMEAG